MSFTVTNGTVEYERVVRPADFESKRFRVSFSFAVEEGADFEKATAIVGNAAQAEVHRRLGLNPSQPAALPAVVAPVQEVAQPAPAGKRTRKSAASADTSTAAASPASSDAASLEDDEPSPTTGAPTTPPSGSESGGSEISDKDLGDALQKTRMKGVTAQQLREAIQSYAERMSEIPQDKRDAFLKTLEGLQPA